MTLTFFSCREEDMLSGWLQYLTEQGEREQAEWETEQDLEHEHALAREWLEDPDAEPWPWYAKRPYTVVRPQVFGP